MDNSGIVKCADLRRRFGEGQAAVDALAGVTLDFIFQFFNLVPVLTAEENLALPVRIAGKQVDGEPRRPT